VRLSPPAKGVSAVIVADPVKARPQWGVIRSTDHGGKFDSGEPRSG
jgi:hypothetical protein